MTKEIDIKEFNREFYFCSLNILSSPEYKPVDPLIFCNEMIDELNTKERETSFCFQTPETAHSIYKRRMCVQRPLSVNEGKRF